MQLFLLICLAVVMVGVIWFALHKLEKNRSLRFQEIADQMGLNFHRKGDSGLQARFSALTLFGRGHSRKSYNVLSGQSQNIDVAVFGYQYTTGGGKNSHTSRQTVMAFDSPHLQLPAFELRPEHMFHKIGQAFGYSDIDFETHPQFSKKYLLRGKNEDAIRDVFTADALEFFEAGKGISVEARDGQLIYYRSGRRIKPEEIQAFMEQAFRCYALFKSE